MVPLRLIYLSEVKYLLRTGYCAQQGTAPCFVIAIGNQGNENKAYHYTYAHARQARKSRRELLSSGLFSVILLLLCGYGVAPPPKPHRTCGEGRPGGRTSARFCFFCSLHSLANSYINSVLCLKGKNVLCSLSHSIFQGRIVLITSRSRKKQPFPPQ